MSFQGVVVGGAAFLIIGIFHPIVIKGEYYFGKKIWPLFLIVGLLLVAVSLWIENQVLSAVLSITGFSSLWSIHELFEQEERVAKGWFPANPNKKE
ncbi:MAG: DUF4491 family protein [Sphaerochaeta sp.]